MKNPTNIEHAELECSADRETGNIWYADLEESPPSLFKGAAIYCFVTLIAAASLAVIAGAAGWIYQHFFN